MKYADALPKINGIPFWAKKDLESNPYERLLLDRGDIVVDVGAHIGLFTIAALEQGAARVFSFEPIQKNVETLRTNVAPYGDRCVIVASALVGSADETTALMRLSGFSGAHQLMTAIAPTQRRDGKTIRVDVKTFRDELRAIAPQVVKIDVEGAEYEMFASLESGDLRSVRSIFIEFHPTESRDQKIATIKNYLRSEGLIDQHHERLRAFTANRGSR